MTMPTALATECDEFDILTEVEFLAESGGLAVTCWELVKREEVALGRFVFVLDLAQAGDCLY